MPELPRRVADYQRAGVQAGDFTTARVELAVRAEASREHPRAVRRVTCSPAGASRFSCNVDLGGTCESYVAELHGIGTVTVTRPSGLSVCVVARQG